MPTLALFAWPLAVLALLRSLPRDQALVWAALTGYLLLPEKFSIDLSGLPAIDKYLVISFTLLIVAMTAGRTASRRKPERRITAVNANLIFGRVVVVLLAVLFLSPIVTMLANRAPLVFERLVIPGMRPWDFVAITSNTVTMILPFLIARRCLASPEAHRVLLVGIAVAGLAYTPLMLVEMRLSPQLHNWVYGYHQHSFLQHIRGGDFRPKVFLTHGLSVGFFTFSAVLAAFALARAGGRGAARWWAAGLYLMLVLVLSKNFGSTMLALIFVPLLFLGSTLRTVMIFVTAIVVLSYPVLRGAHLLPLDGFVDAIAILSEERAASFQYRLDNEEILLEKANEKPMSGWGTWGRNRVYDEVGRDISVPDGRWIIEIGTGGWPNYLAFFGLLSLPLMMLLKVARRETLSMETLALGCIATATMVNLIPNAGIGPIGWMTFGALAGFVQFHHREADGREEDVVAQAGGARWRDYGRPSDARTVATAEAAPYPRKLPRYSR